MSLKVKILIGFVAVYSIVISVLLMIAGRKLAEADTEKLKYHKLEHLITDVQKTNVDIKNVIAQDELKIDSISSIITRVETSIYELNQKKANVNIKYKSQIEELKDKSLLELKQIALTE